MADVYVVQQDDPEDEDEQDSEEEDDEPGDSGDPGDKGEKPSGESDDSEEDSDEESGEDTDSMGYEGESDEGEAESEPEPGDSETGDTADQSDPSLDDEIEGLDFDDSLEKAGKDALKDAMDSGDYIPYSTEKDRIEKAPESDLPQAVLDNLGRLANECGGEARRQLLRIVRGKSNSVFQRGLRRGRVDSSGMHRMFANDDRLFKKKAQIDQKSMAVQLVVDCSGSMSGGMVNYSRGDIEPGDINSKIDSALISAWIFAQTLDLLKIPCEVIGFTTDRHERIHREHELIDEASEHPGFSRYESIYLPIFKGFDEKFGPRQKNRIASVINRPMSILCENIDGESLRLASLRLADRKEDKKVMLVFSDGSPSCAMSKITDLNKDTQKAIQQIEDEGINLVGVGILDPSVKRFYRKHVVLNSIKDLPGRTLKEMSDAILA